MATAAAHARLRRRMGRSGEDASRRVKSDPSSPGVDAARACAREHTALHTGVPSPARVLVIFAHPAFQKSRAHARLLQALPKAREITFHDLYEAYPDFQIDVPAEQARLLAHDTIVFQHPFYWYSCPALLKEWLDLVLEFGFAYGPGGVALRGKSWLTALTTGGAASAYSRNGANYFTMDELLAPFRQTAALCGMNWLPPYIVHGAISASDEALAGHADHYIKMLEALREGRSAPPLVAAGTATSAPARG